MGDGGLTPLYLLVYIKHILLTYSAIRKNSNCLYIFCTKNPIDNVSVNRVL